MMTTNFTTIYPEAKPVTKEQAEIIIGIELPQAALGYSYWTIGYNVGVTTSDDWPGKEEWYKKTKEGVFRRYRGLEVNCYWTEWIKVK